MTIAAPSREAQDFVGRTGELSRFADLLEVVRGGGPRAVFLSGPPGIGKSRLLEEFRGIAEKAGFSAARGRFGEGILRDDLWVWHRVLRSLKVPGAGPEGRDPAREAGPPPLPAADKPSRLRFVENLFAALEETRGGDGVFISLDNLHLAGEDFFAVLLELLEGCSGLPVLVAGAWIDLPAYRRGPFLSFLSEIRKPAWAEELIIDPLSRRESLDLATGMLGHEADGNLLEEIYRKSRGFPLFIGEICRTLRTGGSAGASVAGVWENTVPDGVRTVIETRLTSLSPGCLRLLEKVSLVGESFSESDLRFFLNRSPGEDVVPSLNEALAYGFLTAENGGGEYRFSHGIVYEAIRARIGRDERIEMSRDLARRLEEGRPDRRADWALKLAEWYGLDGTGEGKKKAEEYTFLAADKAYREGRLDEAGRLYENGLDHGTEAARDGEEAERFFQLGRIRIRGGRMQEAMDCLKKAFLFYRCRNDLDGMIRVATRPEYVPTGFPGYENFFESILEALPRESPEEAKVLTYYGADLMMGPGDFVGAERTLNRALGVLSRRGGGSEPVSRHARVFLAFVLHIQGRQEEALAVLEELAEECRRDPDNYTEAHLRYGLAVVLTTLGRRTEALENLDRMIECSVLHKDHTKIGIAYCLKARFETEDGSWDAAREAYDAGLEDFPDHLRLLFHRAMLEYSLGEIEAGDAYARRLGRIRKRTPSGPYLAHIYVAAAEVLRAQCTGDGAGLRRSLAPLETAAKRPGMHPHVRVRAHLLLALAGCVLGDPELAGNHSRELKKLPRINLIRPYFQERVLGLSSHLLGDHGRAEAYFEAALESARFYGDRPMLCRILYEYGRSGIAAGTDSGPGAALFSARRLREARDMARELAVEPLRRLVEAELEKLAAAGERAGPTHFHFSEREKKVLDLMIRGFSNEAIARELHISPYTVANHVHHILKKTGAENRTEAAAMARETGYL
jgi:DNA-binding CsgD family transcriptional regulator